MVPLEGGAGEQLLAIRYRRGSLQLLDQVGIFRLGLNAAWACFEKNKNLSSDSFGNRGSEWIVPWDLRWWVGMCFDSGLFGILIVSTLREIGLLLVVAFDRTG